MLLMYKSRQCNEDVPLAVTCSRSLVLARGPGEGIYCVHYCPLCTVKFYVLVGHLPLLVRAMILSALDILDISKVFTKVWS